MRRLRAGALILCAALAGAARAETVPAFQETAAQHDARMRWFREARLGMFIHWGLYSQPAGEWKDQTITGGAEWIQESLKIPSSQYSALARTWNPTRYDPRAWVRLMKAAGVRYVCITTKHHDGFCLWPTKMNDDWNVAITPGGRDLLQPLAEACRAEGLQFCIYHSVLDWHHPDWPGRPAYNDYARGAPDKARYKTYLYGQLRELFANYGPIGMVWFDGTWDRRSWTSDDGKELEDFTRSLQPSVILDNRSGYLPPQRDLGFKVANAYSYTFAGDYISPEGEVPPTGLPGIDWETCQTMQLPNNWGYNRLVGFRPYKDLLRQLVDVSSKGGNMLLNIGPTAEGEILPQAATCLEKFADWMKVNAESIHATTASPFERLPFDGRATRRGGTIYLHVFAWPANGVLSVPLANRITRARLLAGGAPLSVDLTARGARVSVPRAAPDPVVSVVALDIEGEPQVLPPPVNLAQGQPVEVSSFWPGREKELNASHITDGRPDTLWATEEKARAGWAIVNLGQEAEIREAVLSDAPYGRIRAFDLEAEAGGAWRKLASGTTIGDRRTLTFAPTRARRFRLVIREATDTPTLAEFQLFGQDAAKDLP